MKELVPFQLTKTANAGVPTRLVAAPQCVRSAQIVARAENAGQVYIGALDANGDPDPKSELTLILPIMHDVVYDLFKIFILTDNNGDGVEIFGFE